MASENLRGRADCPNIDINNEKCPCKAEDCPNHGFCCACIENHREKGNLPACVRHLA